MAEVVLFHHVQGLTDGVRAFADELRAGGHTVHTPDLFDGERPATIDDGIDAGEPHRRRALSERADRGRGRPARRPGLRRLLLRRRAPRSSSRRPAPARAARCSTSRSSRSSAEWSFGPWPDGLPVQVHGMDADPFFAVEGDLDAARELVATVGPDVAELFTYPGDKHLFTDSSLPSYDPDATRLVLDRSLAFLGRLGYPASANSDGAESPASVLA